jgi:urease subunit alpha
LIIKGGFIKMAPRRPERVDPHAAARVTVTMFGSVARAVTRGSLTFVSQAGLNAGIKDNFGLANAERGEQHPRRAQAAHGAQRLPRTEIDRKPTRCADGQLLTCEPATTCPWRSATSCFEVPCYLTGDPCLTTSKCTYLNHIMCIFEK